MWNSLITFVVRYEYARALFDKRAALRFAGEAASLFESLAHIEINHATRLQALLPERVVPLRSMFFEKQDYAMYKDEYIDGVSKRHIWTKFLFQEQSPSEWGLLDTLAFCAAAERLETIGYWILGLIPKFRKIAGVIALEESNAEKKIIQFLIKSSNLSKNETQLLIFKWYFRAFASMLILVFTGNK